MVSYDPPYGFPLRRNGTCLSSETSCGHTWGGFYACCPGDSVCPGATESILNNVCCPTESDCTAPLHSTPHCANETGILFNHTGYFCCLPEQTGFWTDSPQDAVGCSDGSPTERGETILNTKTQSFSSTPLSTATASASTKSTSPTSTSSIPAVATTSASDSSSSSSSGDHAGAIAGGVVGGVVGAALIVALVWFFIRGRKRSQQPSGEGAAPIPSSYYEAPLPPTELEARKIPYELESRTDQPLHELPSERY
ncbi:hypothetical protein ETB97_006238 [Aspergillus alliaceus]|uniref:Glycophorin A domain protein n=1 Tax=Petromyces alliaceus TaxID=209559 RepID=A0A5N7C5P6_PETAA|nr:hypothetical protein BDV23DRAFT_184744 [Aspergillus alliaceus]KAF5857124.1 hypothetical protein ETB97_006238 [Aspergillus burnettii]